MLLNLNRLSSARAELELAVQLSPADYKPHVFLGNLHMLSGCPHSALPEYELAARLGAPRELGVDASVLKLRALLESPAAAPGFDSRNCRENR